MCRCLKLKTSDNIIKIDINWHMSILKSSSVPYVLRFYRLNLSGFECFCTRVDNTVDTMATNWTCVPYSFV